MASNTKALTFRDSVEHYFFVLFLLFRQRKMVLTMLSFEACSLCWLYLFWLTLINELINLKSDEKIIARNQMFYYFVMHVFSYL